LKQGSADHYPEIGPQNIRERLKSGNAEFQKNNQPLFYGAASREAKNITYK
jgi:hypothetical protein